MNVYHEMTANLGEEHYIEIKAGEFSIREPDWFGPKVVSAETVLAILENVDVIDGKVVPKIQKAAA